MLHAVLAAYTLCFAGGVSLVVISFFTSRRFSLPSFRDFGLLFASSTLILVVEALKTYERAVGMDFGPGLHVTDVVLSVVGTAGMTWYLLILAWEIVRLALTRTQVVLRASLAAAIGLLGGLKEAAPLLWPQAGPAAILWNANYLALLGVHMFAAGILLLGFTKIENQWLRSIIRTFLIFLGVFAPLAAAQLVIQDIPSSPDILRDYPLEQLAYYLGFVVLALLYYLRYFFLPAGSTTLDLPADFVQRYGISHREADIIEMMARGFSNGAIAEKLFISTVTVKNHVYHIYQKTGAKNKVQMLNMINSSK